MVVAPLEDGAAKRVVRGDIDMAFISEDAGFDLPVSQLGTEGERDILVHGLEGLEDEGVTCGGRLDAVREGGVDEVDEEGWWEEGHISVVGVVGGKEVWAAGKGIRSCKEFSGDVDHLKVEVSKVDKPTL